MNASDASPTVSVVIPSYHRRDSVLALLADLQLQRGVSFEVIVVDDASPDGSAAAVAEHYPDIVLLRNAHNGGPCVTRNRGIHAARGKYIVGLDSDVTVPDAELLSKVASAFVHDPQVSGLAFRLLKPDGHGEDRERWWHPVPIEAFAQRAFETCYFSGTAYAFRREPLLATGLYPEWLYMHFEEVVLGYRFLDQGGKLLYHPRLTVIHHANPVSRRGKIDKYYKPRNQLLFAAACLPLWAALVYAVPRAIFQFGKALRHGSLPSYCRAIRDGVSTALAPDFPRFPVRRETLRRVRALAAMILAAAFFLACGGTARAATSIAYYGITWKFEGDHQAGTFADGEPWVIGPLVVTDITPNPSQSTAGTNNGSMINPVPEKDFGFDSNPVVSRQIKYDPKLNVALALPVSLKAGDALVSVRSHNVYPDYIQVLCALTVLPDAPPEGSFRPGIYGTDRPVRWNAGKLDFSVLRRLRPVPGTPTLQTIEAMLPALPWFEWSMGWSGKHLQPTENTATGNKQYGREIAGKFGDIGLWLNLNFPNEQKRQAAIQTVQCGLDIYSYVKAGGGFYPDGGHKCGRKFPVLLAGLMLHDSDVLALAASPDTFQEDAQTFFVAAQDVGRAVAPPKETYLAQDIGQAEWGVRHRFEPEQDNRSPTATYRAVVGPAMMGEWLAATLMGAQTAWNHAAAFAYMDRNHALYGEGTPFAKQMWLAHRADAPAK